MSLSGLGGILRLWWLIVPEPLASVVATLLLSQCRGRGSMGGQRSVEGARETSDSDCQLEDIRAESWSGVMSVRHIEQD